MTIIDHRILIPAAPDVVWDYISDITHNPDWQVDCQEVIFLTSRREGPGVRWRYAAPNGHESVVAVTAWYNGLGYEYFLVDGVPYRENKGRIRLQEIPEGTIVQWTFTYELGGLLGGMRNALGVSRQVDRTIAESLKTLWQKVKQSGATARPHEAKSLMRDAPNVDARSAYQPRHPAHMEVEGQKLEPVPTANFQTEPPISEDDGQPISIIDEPPVKQDDTRPRPAVIVPSREPVIPPDIEGEPEFLERMTDVDLSRFEPPRDPSDTQPRKPVAPTEPTPTAIVEPPAAAAAPETKFEPDAEAENQRFAPPKVGEETEPLAIPLPEVLPIYRAPLVDDAEPEAEPETTPEPVEELQTQPVVEPDEEAQIIDDAPMTEAATPIVSEPEPVVDTAPAAAIEAPPKPEAQPSTSSVVHPETDEKSATIWEIFGVPRPSETQETTTAQSASAAEPSVAVAEPAPVTSLSLEQTSFPRGSNRVGLRIVLRRRLVRVRRP